MMLAALPDGALPLAVGTALALGALTMVLSPLLSDDTSDGDRTDPAKHRARRPTSAPGDIPSDSGVVALREIEFDRETGKLSDTDYAELKERYTQIALDEMRAAAMVTATEGVSTSISTSPASSVSAAGASEVPVDAAEAAIQRARQSQRACDVCGPRPEPDAVYCSSCGRYLAGACRECGTPVELVGSHFCTNCGENLAAV